MATGKSTVNAQKTQINVSMTIPDKPKSPRQKYIATEKGQDELKN
jgi:hypothetical protein